MNAEPDSRIAFVRAGSGPPVLLVHGNPATHTLWRPVLGAFSAHRSVYAVDLPGFGASPPPSRDGGYRVDAIARSLLEFADQQNVLRFDLVAHSYGAAVAMVLAASHPERIRSLVLITPLADRQPPIAIAARISLVRILVRSIWKALPDRLRRLIIRLGTRRSGGGGYDDRRIREIAEEMRPSTAVVTMLQLMAQLDYAVVHDAIVRLANSSVQILLIGATDDRVIPHEHYLRLRDLLPNAAHLEFQGGHVPIWEFPRQLSGAIESFLDGQN